MHIDHGDLILLTLLLLGEMKFLCVAGSSLHFVFFANFWLPFFGKLWEARFSAAARPSIASKINTYSIILVRKRSTRSTRIPRACTAPKPKIQLNVLGIFLKEYALNWSENGFSRS